MPCAGRGLPGSHVYINNGGGGEFRHNIIQESVGTPARINLREIATRRIVRQATSLKVLPARLVYCLPISPHFPPRSPDCCCCCGRHCNRRSPPSQLHCMHAAAVAAAAGWLSCWLAPHGCCFSRSRGGLSKLQSAKSSTACRDIGQVGVQRQQQASKQASDEGLASCECGM